MPAVNASISAIRPAAIADAPALAMIEHTCFPPEDAFSLRHIRALLRNPRVICLAAQSRSAKRTGSRIAGWCVAFLRRHASGVRSGRIYTLAVDPMLQGQGIARRLLQRSLSHLRAANVRHVYLEVRAANERAIAMYEKFGFALVERMPHYYARGKHGIRMRLALVG